MNSLLPNFVAGRGAVGLLILRLVTGAAFVLHGWPKIQDPSGWMDRPDVASGVPGIFQALAAIAEFGGGLALIPGLLTPLAALGIAATMVGALAMVHLPRGDPFVASSGWPSFELPVGYLANALLLLLLGPGVLSLDALLFRNKEHIGSSTQTPGPT